MLQLPTLTARRALVILATSLLLLFAASALDRSAAAQSEKAKSAKSAAAKANKVVVLPAVSEEVIANDRTALLKEVKEVCFPGQPGEISVFGQNAFAVIAAEAGSRPAAVVVAARANRARIVAFGHNGFFTDRAAGQTKQLLFNAIVWASKKRESDLKGIRVGVRNFKEITKELQQSGIAAKDLSGPTWFNNIKDCTVVLMDCSNEPPQTIAAIESYLKNGGGLLISGLGWYWQSYKALPGEELATDAPMNRLCEPYGLKWTSQSVKRPNGDKDGTLIVDREPLDRVHRLAGVQLIKEQLSQPKEAGSAALVAAALASLEATKELPESSGVIEQLQAIVDEHADEIPRLSPKNPATKTQFRKKALAAIESTVALRTPIERLKPAPSASEHPGAVPETASRVTSETVELGTTHYGWISTGLYAAPGEVVTVRIKSDATELRLNAQVGCHADATGQHERWVRVPRLMRRFALTEEVTKIGNGYGGPIYIIVPEAPLKQPVNVEISGAARAPLFILGKTDVSDWRFSIRDNPAPWGELVSDRIILSVPSSLLRTLDFPDKLMEQWTKVMDCFSTMCGEPLVRPRPERLVPDHQISAGWLHSGYPIMAQDLQLWAGKSVNLEELTTVGEWGFYHEIGHNHQKPDWTFEGTGEVTNNLLGLYVFDTLNKGSRPHENAKPAWQAEREKKYIANGRKFEEWKDDPFLALIMYEQLADQFGWEPYKKVFAEYRALSPEERPKSQLDKRSQWMERMSRATGRNLGPFFDHWGVPVSDEAKAAVKDLPEWVPNAPAAQ